MNHYYQESSRSAFVTVRNLISAASLALLTSFGAAHASAQELSGAVSFPSPDRVQYDIDIAGRPFELAVVLVSLDMAPGGGIPIAGIGTLHIGPAHVLQVATVRLNGTGRASLQYTLPLSQIRTSWVFAQVAFGDPLTRRIRLSEDFIALGHDAPTTDGFWPLVGTYYIKNANGLGRLYVFVWGEKGDRVKIRRERKGRQTVTDCKTLSQALQLICLPWSGTPNKGDTVEVTVNDVKRAVKKF